MIRTSRSYVIHDGQFISYEEIQAHKLVKEHFAQEEERAERRTAETVSKIEKQRRKEFPEDARQSLLKMMKNLRLDEGALLPPVEEKDKK